MSYIKSPVPNWKKGDWWIIETSFIVNISESRHGPENLGIRKFHHIYEVTGEQNIGGIDTWMINIKASRVPSEIPNDHGSDFLWQLNINKNDLSLVKFKMNIRSGNYLISGKEIIKKIFEFKNGNPIIIHNVPVLTPIDIPKLPFRGFPRYLSEEEKELQFVDEKNYQEFYQYIVVIQEIVNEKPTNVIYVTLYNKDIGIRTQKWVPGLPWWKEWRCTTTDRFSGGMWHAKLVEWGNGKNK